MLANLLVNQMVLVALLFLWALGRVIADCRPDIIHAHDYKTNLLGLMLWRATGVLPLSTAHGWTGHSRRERFVYYPFDKRVLARYPRLVAVSSDIRNELVRHGGHLGYLSRRPWQGDRRWLDTRLTAWLKSRWAPG